MQKPGESAEHPINPKTPAPKYQHIERKKYMENSRRQKGNEQFMAIKKHWP